jgi:NAD(P)-dependent dehydrogenase (short-subunit alcohol dehydrogenase family)
MGSADRRGLDVLARQQIAGPGQCRPLRTEVCPITLTTGLAAQHPAPGSAIVTTVNDAVEAFVRAAAAEPSISVRVNAVSPGWVAETLQATGRNPSGGIPAAEVAKITVRQFREGATGSVAPAAKG